MYVNRRREARSYHGDTHDETMEMQMIRRTALAAAVLVAIPAAVRAEDGNWLVRVRAIDVDPQVSTNGALSTLGIDVGSRWAPEVDLSYFFTKNIAVEVIAATTVYGRTTSSSACTSRFLIVKASKYFAPACTPHLLPYHFLLLVSSLYRNSLNRNCP